MALGIVLVVDDEEDIRVALASFLKSTLPGVEVVEAADGKAGLEAFKAHPVDLLLTDYKMPGMDGLQLVKEAIRLRPDVPRVLVTAYPDTRLALHALNEGHVHHFLTKPVEPLTLRDVVKALLDERRARQQREAALARSLAAMGALPPERPKEPAEGGR